jgi:hypothetical protein
MPINFPSSPISGNTYSFNGNLFIYNGYGWALTVGTGSNGVQGSQGPQGPQGVTGSQGPQGFQGVTGSQGNQGVQGPTGPGFNVFSSTSNGATVTGSLSVTISKSLLIPANSYQVDDAPEVIYRTIRLTGTASWVARMYINTTASLTGAVLITTPSAVGGGSFFQQVSRVLAIVSATNDTYIYPSSSGNTNDYTVPGSLQGQSVAIDWTQNNYVIVTSQLNNTSNQILSNLIVVR